MIARLIDDLQGLEEIAAEWDALAVLCAEPSATPAWMLGWLRHVAPAGALPRVVEVRDRKELVALAPFYVTPGRPGEYRVMADDFSASVALLAAPGRAWGAARAVAEVLAAASPSPSLVSLAPISAASPWSAALREGWPGSVRPLACCSRREQAATSSLHGTFDDWMMRRGSEFRRTVRRRLRALERDGGRMRLSTAATVEADIASFIRLHEARWSAKGESRLLLLGERLPRLLEEIAADLVEDARFRLWMVELEGEPICADLSLVAGDEIVGVNTGWDEAHKRLAPAQIVTVHKVEDAYGRGERRLDMGWGSLGYKRAFAEGTDPVEWSAIVPAGRRLPRGLAATAPAAVKRRLAETARRNLDDGQVEKLRGLAGPLRERGDG